MSGKNSPLPLPASKYEDVDQAGKSIIALSSGLQRTTPDVPPPRHHNMGDKQEEQVVRGFEESERQYEDVDPAGYSIFALGSGLQRTAPDQPPARHLSMEDIEKDHVDRRNEELDRKYEDVDPAGYSIFALSSGLQHTAPDQPPPRHQDMEDKKKKKMDERKDESESKQMGEMSEDMELECGGGDMVINSGLKRPVPDLPPPRNPDPGDHMDEDKPSEEPCSVPCNESEDNAGLTSG
ncbi:hypothetical protein Bbelb_226980, partial [Branchiostoma belcheri]